MLKRLFVLFAAFAASGSLALCAQSKVSKLPDAPTASDWQQVQALPTGSDVYVQTDAVHLRCNIGSVAAESFVCNGLALQRAQVETIKRPRKLVSTLAGTAIGVAVGVAVGASIWRRGDSGSRGRAAAGGVILFAPVGALVGYLTDFTRVTIYRRSR